MTPISLIFVNKQIIPIYLRFLMSVCNFLEQSVFHFRQI